MEEEFRRGESFTENSLSQKFLKSPYKQTSCLSALNKNLSVKPKKKKLIRTCKIFFPTKTNQIMRTTKVDLIKAVQLNWSLREDILEKISWHLDIVKMALNPFRPCIFQ